MEMEKRFLDFSWEQLLEEDAFISWITRNKNDNEWKSLIEQHPEFEKEVLKAKQIHSLINDYYENIDDSTVQFLWKEIEDYYQRNKQRKRVLRAYQPIGLVASVFLIFSIGILALFYWQRIVPGDYQFLSILEEKEAYILLANGEKISMHLNNSKIIIHESGDGMVINDSLINLENFDTKSRQNMNELVMPRGSTSELQLADGTVVWLNAGSRLAFPAIFSKKKRKVYLEGEAFFEVAYNAGQPFVADAGLIDVIVSGTEFNLSAYPEENSIEAVLIEGVISLSNAKTFGLQSEEVLLKPNQRAVFQREDREFSVFEEHDVDIYTAWINGLLIYKQESLESVLRKVERYYNVRIELPENYPSDDRISGKLDLQYSIEDVMRILADASGFRYRIETDKIIIEKQDQKLNINLEKSHLAWPPDSFNLKFNY
jgi:transmembrane sensor